MRAVAPLVIAHRGASAYALENTLAAFAEARALGADGVELDIHAAADGELVVHHDPQIAGRAIAAMSLAEVRAIRLSNGEPPPTLAEALDVLGETLRVFVEVKHLPPNADARLFAVLDAGPAPSRYAVHGFDHRIVRRLRAARKDYGYGALSCSYLIDPAGVVRSAGAGTLWQAEELVDHALVAAVHDAGLALIAWTVDRPERAAALAAMGVDGICTNRPDVVREAVR